MSNSLRFKEAAFARHFCLAFPTLRKLYAPFWTYDCVAFQLCPRFKHGGNCRAMADPYLITRGAVGLGKLGGGPSSLASAEAAAAEATANAADAAAAAATTSSAKAGGGAAGGAASPVQLVGYAAPAPSEGPQPVLVLGEGAAVEVRARLLLIASGCF